MKSIEITEEEMKQAVELAKEVVGFSGHYPDLSNEGSQLISRALISSQERVEELERANEIRLDQSIGYAAERDALKRQLETAKQAMRDSIARSDDYGDSHCSKPIRTALAQLETKEGT